MNAAYSRGDQIGVQQTKSSPFTFPMTRRSSRWRLWAGSFLLVAFGAHPSAQRGDAAALFQRGLIALHQFEYEDANEAFRDAQRIDPMLGIAYWGEAMTYHQTLWRREDVPLARQALARLGPTPAARLAKVSTPRDQGLLSAVEVLFGDGDAATRHQRYADEMGRFYEREPDDPDVASLYALALLGTMSRSLIGYVDSHEGHSQMLAGSATQTQVAAILDKVLRAHPEHPGALHYLLHNYDDPEHASLGLAAARTLARLAPEASHALHMPSHIFLQLGLWQDAALSDRAAFAASDKWVARKHLTAAMRNYHALAWLEYELLQLGRHRQARATIDELAPVVKADGQLPLLSDLSTMRARFVIETANWPLMARETNFGNANELFAIGISAARGGNPDLAQRARQGLADRVNDPREGDLRPAIAVMERELAGIIELTAGRRAEAVSILRSAAESEADLPPPLGLPQPIKPAPELLGEVLIEVGRPAEAVAFFERTLRRHPNRTASVVGLARATAAAEQPGAARRYYGQLLTTLDHADADLPIAREARTALDTLAHDGNVSLTRSHVSINALWLGLAATGAIGIAFLIRGRARRAAMKAAPARRHRRKKAPGDPGPSKTFGDGSPKGLRYMHS
jgi:tetratricopeptide (TPR) repeat protein